jgi:hypothetical protein
VSIFVFLLVAGAIALHYIPRWYGGDPGGYTLSWDSAIGTAFVVAFVGTALAYAIGWRTRQ